MASYTATSTKSYMAAMSHMEDALSKLVPPKVVKKFNIDNERQNSTDILTIVDRFQDLSVDKIKNIIDKDDTSSAAIHYIESQCEKADQDLHEAQGTILKKIKILINSVDSEEELQSNLFDMLGFEKFELIAKIIQNRIALKDGEQTDIGSKFLSKEQQQQLVGERRMQAKNAVLDRKLVHKKYPHVFKNDNVADLLLTGNSFVLPEGSTRTNYGNYDEVVIPCPEKVSNKWISSKQLVKIKDLDFLCKGTFTGYKSLNQMQSLVYPVAYNTNENMLVCAPTGAGKTDVALLTILHTIDQFLMHSTDDDGEVIIDVDYEEFKIVYVAPLKALASEIVDKYNEKLKWLGITARELTGDMQLTKSEILKTQIIVTTPEKWDVITRKSSGDTDFVSKVKLLIIDEVHLLHEDRGSVIETLVARTLRQVEASQSMIRVVGLSATLPNYADVADFLGVNRSVGMFYFDQSFRPCPLEQQVIGVKGKAGSKISKENIDNICYKKLVENIREGHQVMVFVNSRKDTVKSCNTFVSLARSNHELDLFNTMEDCSAYNNFKREMGNKNRDNDMKELFQFGFGIHHAGMLRSDRRLTESMFLKGAIKVLCCTATLAWGVNLPAAVVIIKGTQIYDSKQGGFVDMGISDVLQIFGRAGRPQFESFGTGILCTTRDKLDSYLSLLTNQHPIESKLGAKLVDCLNAEISLGTVTNVEEAIQWLGYTYMFVRMRQNPFIYGISSQTLQEDPLLINKRRELVISTARKLHRLQMVIFDENSGSLMSKNLGRIASDFYLLNGTVEIFNQLMNPLATEADVISMVCSSGEFDSIKFREEEKAELKMLEESNVPCQIGSEVESTQGKTNILFQSFLSQASIKNSTLISDMSYISQNAARICRSLFMIGIDRRWGSFSKIMLNLCKSIDKRLWCFEHPLAQFDLPQHILKQIKAKNPNINDLKEMEVSELGDLVHNNKMGRVLFQLIDKFPLIEIHSEAFPITKNVMRVKLSLEPDFSWDERYHGNIQIFWVFVQALDKSDLLHVEKFILNRKQMKGLHEMDFMIPLGDPLPPQISVNSVSDSYLGSESVHLISFQHLIRPTNETIRTNLLKLHPLPLSALHNSDIEKIYNKRFQYFNPMQTMTFHSLYHSDSSVFVGSPTGSGKTIVAELAMWHAFNTNPTNKVVYIAPMKALVRERVDDWRSRICSKTKLKLVELTGDSLPDAKEVREASIIVTTPEKFDGISRNWQTRKFVQQISLVIMDEIHLLASDRGPILEMIVSRMNYISAQTSKNIRLLGMSTAVSNAIDMASWLGVKEGLFNFPQSVRPVPLQMYIDGFPDNLAFGPLMKSMNKPAFLAIKQHSPNKPVLIFVASRRQTRLTALDLIHLSGMESNPRRFLKMDDEELHTILSDVKDETLRLSLQFGIALHHAGLVDSDRRLSHKLFESGKVQILIATSTLAWGVNLPAHLVIIKGTQFFDAKIEAYRDMDLTDVLQMMGRAGRPAYDTTGIAVVYTKESKKTFYKHFINIGFPVESSLHKVLDDHLGAEISSGSITTRQEAMDFLTWTFLFRRAHNNPTYYGIEDVSTYGISQYLGTLIDSTIDNLSESKCLIASEKGSLIPTPFLHISSFYYLSHKTVRNFLDKATKDMSFRECIALLCDATEYDELATRHGEELINLELSNASRYPADDMKKEFIWDPHVKAFLLLQAYMSRIELPIVDYVQDTVSVLDQSLRILQAYIDIASELGYLAVVFQLISIMRCVKQRCWFDDAMVSTLPGLRLVSMKTQQNMFPKNWSNIRMQDIPNLGTAKINAFWKDLSIIRDDFNTPGENERVTTSKKEEFLKIASHLPSSELKVAQKGDNSMEISLLFKNSPLNADFKVYAPHFPKIQKESWFIILADDKKSELLLINRATPTTYQRKSRVHCILDLPDELKGMELNVYCVHDAYDISYSQKIQLTV